MRSRRGAMRGPVPTAGPRAVQAFTLVELLVALALAALLAGLLGSTLAGGASVAGRIGRTSEAAQLRLLATSLLVAEIELAGRGIAGDGLAVELDPTGEGGDRILVRYLAEAHRAEPLFVEATFFAALDGRGRPSLYRQPDDGVRQPWLLGVTGVHVTAGRAPDGSTLTRSQLTAGATVAALEIEIRFADGRAVHGWAATTRSGTLSLAPLPAAPLSAAPVPTAPEPTASVPNASVPTASVPSPAAAESTP